MNKEQENKKEEKRKKYMQAYLVQYRETHHEIKITLPEKDY
jgi:hypothetical protein